MPIYNIIFNKSVLLLYAIYELRLPDPIIKEINAIWDLIKMQLMILFLMQSERANVFAI